MAYHFSRQDAKAHKIFDDLAAHGADEILEGFAGGLAEDVEVPCSGFRQRWMKIYFGSKARTVAEAQGPGV